MSAVFVIGGLVALALAIVGVLALAAPHRMAHAYGLPVQDGPAGGFVRAMGIRDLVIAAVLGATVYFHDIPLLVVVAVAGIVLSVTDLVIAYHTGGKHWRREHVTHVGGVVAFVLVLAMALFAVGM